MAQPQPALIRYRHVLAPLVGVAVLAGALLLGDVPATWSILMGALVWGGCELVLVPRDPYRRLRDLPMGALIAQELARADERLAMLAANIRAIDDRFLKSQLERIHAAASSIRRELVDDPGLYEVVRKALGRYLEAAVSLSASIRSVHGVRGLDPAVRQRVEAALGELEAVLVDYRNRMVDSDEFNLQVDLDVLKGDLMTEGRRPGASSPAPSAAPSPAPSAAPSPTPRAPAAPPPAVPGPWSTPPPPPPPAADRPEGQDWRWPQRARDPDPGGGPSDRLATHDRDGLPLPLPELRDPIAIGNRGRAGGGSADDRRDR